MNSPTVALFGSKSLVVAVALAAGLAALNCASRRSSPEANAPGDGSAAARNQADQNSGQPWTNAPTNANANPASNPNAGRRTINDATSPVVAQTQPRASANFAAGGNATANANANPDANAAPSNGPVLPAFGTPDDILFGRLNLLRKKFEWPGGMYPFGMRHPAPPPSDDSASGPWKLIYMAQAVHRRREYADAIKYLEFAYGDKETADSGLILFNIGAANQSLAATQPDKRQAAIDAFKRVLALQSAELELRWANESFRHFAAAALSQLVLENGQRVDAVKYAYESAYTYPMRDPIAGTPLPLDQAEDQLLPAIYAYAGADITSESTDALRQLLQTGRPQLSGPDVGTLLVAFARTAAEQVVDSDKVTPQTPRCFTRPFLWVLVKNWLADFPSHPKKSELLRVVESAKLRE